jgi:hypothetical protein
MKKALLIVVIILAVIVALPLINLIRWTFQTHKPLDIILVDKTVPNVELDQHKSFNWILTNERFVKKENKRSYSYKNDYFGFTPKISLRERLMDKRDYRIGDLIDLASKNDVVYFADTYGVFTNDWYRGSGSFAKSRRSRKLYGGLNNADNLLIKEMKDRNKLVILEYNSFDYPTIQFESNRIQDRLGITFSGWTGKYFSTLDTIGEDFPIWMTGMYRKQYNLPWKFKKAGIVVVKDKYIIVLEEGTDLKNPMPHIITDSVYAKKYNLPESVAFDNWFDIIDPLANSVISKFKIETTSLGDSLLIGYGLTADFPAVIRDPVAARTYYFSGNFANNTVPMWTSRFKGVDKLKGILYSDKPDDTRRFFWLYYRPLMTGIITEYYNSINNK